MNKHSPLTPNFEELDEATKKRIKTFKLSPGRRLIQDLKKAISKVVGHEISVDEYRQLDKILDNLQNEVLTQQSNKAFAEFYEFEDV